MLLNWKEYEQLLSASGFARKDKTNNFLGECVVRSLSNKQYLLLVIIVFSEILYATEYLPPVLTYECQRNNYRTGKWLTQSEAFSKVIEDQPYWWLFPVTTMYYWSDTDEYGVFREYCETNDDPDHPEHGSITLHDVILDHCSYNLGSELITIG